jgi:hypothetical protein
MSKIIFQDKLNKKPEIKTIMLKIQNEIKDIVITKYLSVIMLQDKEISFLKNQCEDFLKLTAKILKKNIITETKDLNSCSKINKVERIHSSKKSTLNSSNDNLNNNSKLFFQNNHNEISKTNRIRSEKKLNSTKQNINIFEKVKNKIFNNFSPLQRSESSSELTLEKKNNLNSSSLNNNIISCFSESTRKQTYNILNENSKNNNQNSLTKSFSNFNSNYKSCILNKYNDEIKNNKYNNNNTRNKILNESYSKKKLSSNSPSIFDNKHCRIIQKKIQYNKAFSSTSFISHINNFIQDKEKLKVNTSKSILNNSNIKNNNLSFLMTVNNISNNNVPEKDINITEKNSENNNGKLGNSRLNSYLFRLGN